MLTATLFLIFFVFAFMGVPIAVALLAASAIPLYFFTTTAMTVVPQRLFVSMDSFSLMALPFFMIAGGLMAEGGVSKRLVNFANSIVGGLPGGLAIVAFVASAFMGAISGSATATSSTAFLGLASGSWMPGRRFGMTWRTGEEPLFCSSWARISRARWTTGCGTPASRATSMP